MSTDKERPKAFNNYFVFTGNLPLFWVVGRLGEDQEDKVPPTIREVQAQDHLRKMNIHKSMGPGKMYPRFLKQLSDRVTKLLPIIFKKPWQLDDVPGDWRKENMMAILKKCKKEEPGSCQPVNLTSVSGKITEQIPQEAMIKHMEDRKVIQDSRYGFTKGKSCLNNLVMFYDGVIASVDRED